MRVTMPCLSVAASGTIGKLLTFATKGVRSRVTLYRSHKDAQSAAQLAAREHWKDGIRFWRLIDDEDRAVHTYTYGAMSRTAFAAWQQQVMRRKHEHRLWLNPQDAGKDGLLGKMEFWLAGRDFAEGGPWDISGRARGLTTSGLDLVEGDRGSCWHTDGDTGPTYVEDTANLGDLEELTIGIRMKPTYDQGDQPTTMPIFQATSGAPTRGFRMMAFTSGTHFVVVDDAVSAVAITTNKMEAGVWREWVCVFQGGATKRIKIYADGVKVADSAHVLEHMESNTLKVYVMRDPWVTTGFGDWHNAFVYRGIPDAFRI